MAEKNDVKDVKKTVDVQKFKERKLRAINQMKNKAKARALAERLSRL